MELEYIKQILDSAYNIRPHEVGCDDCEEEMNEYADYVLEEKQLDKPLNLIKDHLELCRDCSEEFQSLLEALNSATGKK